MVALPRSNPGKHCLYLSMHSKSGLRLRTVLSAIFFLYCGVSVCVYRLFVVPTTATFDPVQEYHIQFTLI